jgi:hypothetical protein
LSTLLAITLSATDATIKKQQRSALPTRTAARSDTDKNAAVVSEDANSHWEDRSEESISANARLRAVIKRVGPR